ncbi:hypothetical protein, partial [Escherichia coli]|uniref:hypothetical protein n=1 Tax=Escherichia coli TaxID=562 RepID=UPI001BFC3650
TFFTAPAALENAEPVNPSSVLRLRLERGDFPFVECRFGSQASVPTDWADWVDDVVGNPRWKQVLLASGALEAVQLSRRLSIPRQGAAIKNLEFACSRWSSDSHSFAWAWGESGLSLEDVFILTRLSLRGGNILDIAQLSQADRNDV